MEVEITEAHDYKIITLSGQISQLKDSIFLKSLINSLIEEKHYNIAISMKDMHYIDSSAINVLIYTKSQVEKFSGQFCLIEPNEYVSNVLSVVGVSDLFTIHPNKEKLHK